MLQDEDEEEEPEQYCPPPDGAGLLQERDRDLVPPPQFLLQLPQLPQPPQFPFTARPVQLNNYAFVMLARYFTRQL